MVSQQILVDQERLPELQGVVPEVEEQVHHSLLDLLQSYFLKALEPGWQDCDLYVDSGKINGERSGWAGDEGAGSSVPHLLHSPLKFNAILNIDTPCFLKEQLLCSRQLCHSPVLIQNAFHQSLSKRRGYATRRGLSRS